MKRRRGRRLGDVCTFQQIVLRAVTTKPVKAGPANTNTNTTTRKARGRDPCCHAVEGTHARTQDKPTQHSFCFPFLVLLHGLLLCPPIKSKFSFSGYPLRDQFPPRVKEYS
ncbi:hypothetical protein ABW19_dt0204702 [Dactylella cylindrospora]|nr:hypothetical protein ABW19_dt0204702 [Dactylella cylindrospora]